jgi:predicted Zn-ribbon and HTH transcriptional regulator
MSTIRQKIIAALKLKPASSYGLSHLIGASHKAIEDHLNHVAKSVGSGFKMIPSECRGCGFKFNKRDRTTKPTKCPQCRGEDLFPPLFFIESENG